MELSEAINSRRSVRVFTDKKIEDNLLEKIIEAGNNAPSHCNTQGWKFVFIDDQEIKDKIFENGGSHVIKNSPYGIMTIYDTSTSDNTEYTDWVQSASAAQQNMLLKIHELGLGGCWVCHLPRKKVLAKILKIQKPYSPVAYLALGYPKNQPSMIPRKKDLKDIYSKNAFVWVAKKTSFKITAKRLLRKGYYYMPSFLKKITFPFVDKFIKKFHN